MDVYNQGKWQDCGVGPRVPFGPGVPVRGWRNRMVSYPETVVYSEALVPNEDPVTPRLQATSDIAQINAGWAPEVVLSQESIAKISASVVEKTQEELSKTRKTDVPLSVKRRADETHHLVDRLLNVLVDRLNEPKGCCCHHNCKTSTHSCNRPSYSEQSYVGYIAKDRRGGPRYKSPSSISKYFRKPRHQTPISLSESTSSYQIIPRVRLSRVADEVDVPMTISHETIPPEEWPMHPLGIRDDQAVTRTSYRGQCRRDDYGDSAYRSGDRGRDSNLAPLTPPGDPRFSLPSLPEVKAPKTAISLLKESESSVTTETMMSGAAEYAFSQSYIMVGENAYPVTSSQKSVEVPTLGVVHVTKDNLWGVDYDTNGYAMLTVMPDGSTTYRAVRRKGLGVKCQKYLVHPSLVRAVPLKWDQKSLPLSNSQIMEVEDDHVVTIFFDYAGHPVFNRTGFEAKIMSDPVTFPGAPYKARIFMLIDANDGTNEYFVVPVQPTERDVQDPRDPNRSLLIRPRALTCVYYDADNNPLHTQLATGELVVGGFIACPVDVPEDRHWPS